MSALPIILFLGINPISVYLLSKETSLLSPKTKYLSPGILVNPISSIEKSSVLQDANELSIFLPFLYV